MQAIGLCRFSYPSLGGFKIEHETIEDRIAFLFSHDRLEERFRLFETLTLPAVAAQTDDDFTLIIVIGDDMPKPAKDRLFDLTQHIPQIDIQSHAPTQHRPLMKDIFHKARSKKGQPCLHWRLDDDDAMSVDFIEKLRLCAEDNKKFLKKHRCVAVDFNQGYNIHCTPDQIKIEHTYKPMWAVALGMYVAPHDDFTIMSFAHNKMGQFMPVISDPSECMYLRSENSFNDSAFQLNGQDPITNDIKALFQSRFAVDIDALQTRFSTSL